MLAMVRIHFPENRLTPLGCTGVPQVRLSIYHHPLSMYIKTEDPDLPAYYYDPLIHPIAAYRTDKSGKRGLRPEQEDVGLDDDEWALPDGIAPLLGHLPVYTENTASGVALLWAPAPFNQRTGYTRRAIDVPLVNAWFMVSHPSGWTVGL